MRCRTGAQGIAMNRCSKILIAIGTVLILAAASLMLYNVWDAHRADLAAQRIEAELAAQIGRNRQNREEEADLAAESADREMPVVTIDGVQYIGTLSVPAEDLTLPVQYSWSYEALRSSPCRYTGSYLTDDLVICGHNYARHFSPIRWLAPGDDVYFETADGEKIHYTVLGLETVRPTDIGRMLEKQDRMSGSWDLTLFTCNPGGQTRCAVRCARADDNP